MTTVKDRQKNKFDKLVLNKKVIVSKASEDIQKLQERWVHNKSSKTLDPVTTNNCYVKA